MKTTHLVEIVATEKARLPIQVCMHLAESARNDERVMRDATALVAAGLAVTIVDIERDRTCPAEEDVNGVHLQHIFMPGYFVPAHFKLYFLVKLALVILRGTVRLLRQQADIYHTHVEKALPACYIAACIRGKPLIFDAPDLILSDPRIRRWPKLRFLAIRFLRHIVASCSGVITASPYYASELRALYSASDVTVIRNVPTYRIVERSDRLRQHLGLEPDVRIALYQGNIQANRGLDCLVRAARFLEPNIVIVLMGSAVELVRSQLEALIASEQAADRVKLLPAVPYAELFVWTASADIGLTLFPPDYSQSIRYTLPNKLFEYLMAGRPVLSSQLDAIAEVIQTYDVGQIVPSLVPSAIGTAINAMLADSAALARMSHNALEASRQEFHWEKEQQVLVGLYQRILAVPGEKSPSIVEKCRHS